MLTVARSQPHETAHAGASVSQQTLAGLRSEQTRLLFVSALLGFGFIGAKLLGANSLSVTILLLISLGFFALTIGASLLVFHCEILGLKRTLEGRAAGLAVRAGGISEVVAQVGFALALLLVVATIIVHLSLGGIA